MHTLVYTACAGIYLRKRRQGDPLRDLRDRAFRSSSTKHLDVLTKDIFPILHLFFFVPWTCCRVN